METDDNRKKIMIVDDSPLMLRSMKKVLDEAYKVFVATSGEQALQFILKKQPDLVLLDYEMPEMNGAETFEEMKKNDFMGKIPVIFLSGVTDGERMEALSALNPAGILAKPVKNEELFSAIEQAMKRI